jgi:hypothetical protein
MIRTVLGTFLGLGILSQGCGGGDPSGARVRLALDNQTGTGTTAQAASGVVIHALLPSVQQFSMKLADFYLAEDVDPQTQNNIGNVAELWISPTCTSADNCAPFELARSTADVNAALNSEALDVAAGTYRYVRITFCYMGERPTEPDVQWQASDMSAPSSFISGVCAATSAEFTPPLVLHPGDSVDVSLGYDLTNLIGRAPLGSDVERPGVCAPNASGTADDCLNEPQFVPAIGTRGGGTDIVVGDGGRD